MICDNLSVNEKGHLTFAGRDTAELAEKYGTPLYLMDEGKIREKCRIYKRAMTEYFGGASTPLFASKSLCFKRVYEIVKEEGMGIDVVSPGELYVALRAGFPAENAYFHGNNKSDADVAFAMDNGIGHFVCDNEDELSAIDSAAGERGIKQKILLRLTPGIDPHTHAKINTGRVDSKFGAAIETGQALALTALALEKKNVIVEGFHCHIGSQIFECEPFLDAADIMLRFMAEVKEKLGFEAGILNLGGGMGVPYTESDPAVDYDANLRQISEFMRGKCRALGLAFPAVLTEPGRSIVADAGLTLYTVGGKKEIPGFRNYVSVDGGMPDNPRYALYQSAYTVVTANLADKPRDYRCTVAGRCCESGDLLAEDVLIAEPVRGDLLAVLTTGAYNYAMSSNYNAVLRPPVVMIDGGRDYLAVRRETYGDLVGCQI